MSREDVESSSTRNEGTLRSYLRSALIGGFALGALGFLVDWGRSLPPPEVPWHGPELGVFYVCLLIGIFSGLLGNHITRKRQGGGR